MKDYIYRVLGFFAVIVALAFSLAALLTGVPALIIWFNGTEYRYIQGYSVAQGFLAFLFFALIAAAIWVTLIKAVVDSQDAKEDDHDSD